MILDAIFQRLLVAASYNPWRVMLWLLASFTFVGIVAPLFVSLALDLLARTKKAKARLRRDLNAELLAKYEAMCKRALEAEAEQARLSAENIRLVELVREEQSHSVDFATRARAQLRTRT